MAGTDLQIVITAKDGTSQTFKAIGSSASAMGASVSKGAAQADKGLDQVTKSAKDTDSAFGRLKGNATAYGAALGTAGLALIKLGESARTQDRLIDGLTRAYGDGSAQIIQFSEDLQDQTRFSNDAAQASLLLANALSQNYGFAAGDMELLLQRSADLAQIYGISLPDAMQRTSSAMRGEGESAELLGLNLSDAAIAAKALEAGLVGWNVPGALTESEKAAFRFKVFMEQSEFAAGAAADAVEGAGGKFRQFANEMQDAGQGVGQFLGPIGEVAAEFAPLALLAPVAGAGIGKFGAAVKAATGATTGFSAATSLLGLAFNPVTLGVGALALVGYKLYSSWNDGKVAAEEFAGSLLNLADAIELARRRGDTGLADQAQGVYDLVNSIADLNAEQEKLIELQTDPAFVYPSPDPGVTEAAVAAVKAQEDAILQLQDTAGLTTPVIERLSDAMSSPDVDVSAYFAWVDSVIAVAAATTDAADDVEALQLILSTPLSDFSTNINSNVVGPLKDMQASLEDTMAVTEGWQKQFYELQFDGFKEGAYAVRNLANAWEEGTDPLNKIVGSLTDATGEITYFTETVALNTDQLLQASIAYDRVNESISSGNVDLDAVNTELERLSNLESPIDFLNGLSTLAYDLENTDKYAKQLTATMLLGAAAASTWAGAFGIATEQAIAHSEAVDFLNQTTIDYIANGDNILKFLVEMDADLAGATTGNGKFAASLLDSADATLLLAYNLDEASDALDGVLATFDQIDALGSRADSAGSIADKLIGAPGELGTLQDLWARVSDGTSNAALAYEDYTNAISAGESIQRSNANIQDDLTVIQAKQIPLLAEQTLAYERYIHQLSLASAEEQQHALYLSDSANQAKIAEIASVAYAASIGEIPLAVASDIILNSAQADPILADLLEQYGYIERGANGEITVTIPDGESTIDVLERIDLSIRNLVAVLDDDPLTIPITATDEATPVIEGVVGDGTAGPVYVDVEAEDNATTPIEALKRGLEQDPIVLTVTYDTHDQGTGDAAGPGTREIKMLATVDDDQAIADINALAALVSNTSGSEAVLKASLDDDATPDIKAVDSLHRALNGNISTLRVNANTANADSAINRIRSYNGDVLATSYYNIVTRYSSVGSPGAFQHGGVVHKAHGGVIAELAEAGPEIVHFASGGTAIAGMRGLYNLTPGDYVQPANSVGQVGSGRGPISITVPVYGNIYGMEDLATELMPVLVNAIVQANEMYRRGMGEL